jgi:hypothetical protein
VRAEYELVHVRHVFAAQLQILNAEAFDYYLRTINICQASVWSESGSSVLARADEVIE